MPHNRMAMTKIISMHLESENWTHEVRHRKYGKARLPAKNVNLAGLVEPRPHLLPAMPQNPTAIFNNEIFEMNLIQSSWPDRETPRSPIQHQALLHWADTAWHLCIWCNLEKTLPAAGIPKPPHKSPIVRPKAKSDKKTANLNL